jgi:hypothetical protein
VSKKTKPGTYFVLACGDDLGVVSEFDESDNCVASAGTIEVQVPNLVVSSVSDPPDTATGGTVFSVTDTTANSGTFRADPSTTQYYLSLDGAIGGGDILLTGSRAIPQLAAGANSTGAVDVTVPVGTAAGTYFVLACADDTTVVGESKENDNCRASVDTVLVS